MSESCRAVISCDGEFFEFLTRKTKPATLVTFSENSAGDVYVKRLKNSKVTVTNNTDNINFQCDFRLLGLHNLSNLACAIAITGGLNLTDETYIQGIENCEPVAGRLEPIRVNENLLIINDSYNANPSSVEQAINVLDEFEGYKVFVFGDMGELGDESKSYHQDVGMYANTKSIDLLITIGSLSRETGNAFTGLHKHLDNHQQVVEEILSLQEENVVVLVKASRFMGLDKVVSDVKLKAA
jgi:UDP-N-acetylmuramoyl-tripeptide--D-alanyl-D-alanine ligase